MTTLPTIPDAWRTYYNEIDPYAAQWLRNLIAAGHIAAGDVDERSIHDVQPADLIGYKQCHFFAGIGGWSHALRLAGWEDDRPVWTGSCPCQPYSVAGKGKAQADERHLWPEWNRLIRVCRPATIFGEQVAAAIGHSWLDDVSADLENEGYACGAAVLGAHSVGSPHIRQRLYFVALADGDIQRCERESSGGPAGLLRAPDVSPEQRNQSGVDGSGVGRMADAQGGGCEGRPLRAAGWLPTNRDAEIGVPGRVGDSDRANGQWGTGGVLGSEAAFNGARQGIYGRLSLGPEHASEGLDTGCPGPLHGFWRDADWLLCRDGCWRPVEPGSFPLAYGVSGRVGRLRAYGNAIVPQVAAAFIRAVMECRP